MIRSAKKDKVQKPNNKHTDTAILPNKNNVANPHVGTLKKIIKKTNWVASRSYSINLESATHVNDKG